MVAIFGILAIGFLLYSAFLSLKSGEDEQENILLEVVALFAGVRLALIGLRTGAEIALVDHNQIVADNFNAGATFMVWINYIVIFFILIKLVYRTFKVFGGK